MTAMIDSADERLSLLSIWAQQHISSPFQGIEPASGDASFRRYFRVRYKNGSAVVMDAPPEREPIDPFLDVAQRLHRVGVAAPKVLSSDRRRGFVLLQDLGETTYLGALRARREDADRLYGDAIHVLVTMQAGAECAGLPDYDEALLRAEMALFREWLVERYLGLELDARDAAAWSDTVDVLVASALAQPRTFVHRDYHSRNLMVGAPGSPGVLDFQDALVGPLTYDIVSLLKDCYISWPCAQRERWWAQYLALLRQTPLAADAADGEALRQAFDLMGVQRHLKASGIFARLHLRDGKDGYLPDIPRTLRYITDFHDPQGRFAWLQAFIEERVLRALAA